MQALKSVLSREQLQTGVCIQQCDELSFWCSGVELSAFFFLTPHVVAELRNLGSEISLRTAAAVIAAQDSGLIPRAREVSGPLPVHAPWSGVCLFMTTPVLAWRLGRADANSSSTAWRQ